MVQGVVGGKVGGLEVAGGVPLAGLRHTEGGIAVVEVGDGQDRPVGCVHDHVVLGHEHLALEPRGHPGLLVLLLAVDLALPPDVVSDGLDGDVAPRHCLEPVLEELGHRLLRDGRGERVGGDPANPLAGKLVLVPATLQPFLKGHLELGDQPAGLPSAQLHRMVEQGADGDGHPPLGVGRERLPLGVGRFHALVLRPAGGPLVHQLKRQPRILLIPGELVPHGADYLGPHAVVHVRVDLEEWFAEVLDGDVGDGEVGETHCVRVGRIVRDVCPDVLLRLRHVLRGESTPIGDGDEQRPELLPPPAWGAILGQTEGAGLDAPLPVFGSPETVGAGEDQGTVHLLGQDPLGRDEDLEAGGLGGVLGGRPDGVRKPVEVLGDGIRGLEEVLHELPFVEVEDHGGHAGGVGVVAGAVHLVVVGGAGEEVRVLGRVAVLDREGVELGPGVGIFRPLPEVVVQQLREARRPEPPDLAVPDCLAAEVGVGVHA